MAKNKPAPCPKRDPTDGELELIAAARARHKSRLARPGSIWTDGQIDAAHSDPASHVRVLADALGTTSNDFLGVHLAALDYASRQRGEASGKSITALNSAVALVAAIAPESELEAALAVQMAGVHSLASEMLGRARQTDRTDHIALYGGLAVKLTRTFALQVEALSKLRGGGKQTVEVKHVYVNGNAVVGDVHSGGVGGGGCTENCGQPHAQALEHSPGAQVPAVWREDPEGHAMPVSRSAGSAEVSNAWRDQPGRACRDGER